MRATTAILLTAIGAASLSAPLADVASAEAASRTAVAGATTPPTEFSAQERRRPRVRVYRQTYDRGVIPSYFPGSNAVRDCRVSYVQEFRPSGTVIAPHMRCVWRQP